MWFCFDANSGMSEHATEEMALQEASERVSDYLDFDGWEDGVESVIVGRITHRAKETESPPPGDVSDAMKDDPEYKPPFEIYCRYDIKPI